ncbi:hypothetical protein F5888DRAFT_1623020, partial [Russula emetica]
PQFTPENVERQLQRIHFLKFRQSYSSEKPVQFDLIIKQLRTNRQQVACFHTLGGLVDSKDDEIEWRIIRDKIGTLDSSTSKIGHGLAEKV